MSSNRGVAPIAALVFGTLALSVLGSDLAPIRLGVHPETRVGPASSRSVSRLSGCIPSRADVERMRAAIGGRTLIVDWHGTWDYATIQAALDAAESGDTIIVLPSTGSPNGAYVENITIPAIPLTLRSINSQDPAIVAATVIDGNQAGSVVTVAEGATEATQIEGFTIRNGGGLSSGADVGGGVFCGDASPSVVNNVIVGNSANAGGGIYCGDGSPVIANNHILGNVAFEYVGTAGRGAGIFCGSSAVIANNVIEGNQAFGVDSFIHGHSNSGGGVYCSYSPSVTLVNNTIRGNVATRGGGIHFEYSDATVINTIVAFNSSGISVSYSYDPPTLRSNCVYGNTAYDYDGVTNPTGTDGNISADPNLADLAYGNSHIQPDSPCVDAGDDAVVQVGWLDIDGQARILGAHVDIGADESDGTVWPDGPPLIVRVSPDGDDANDGSSWLLAKRTVQAGIEAASAQGGEVWVAASTYLERITLRPYAHLYGGFAGTETERDDRDWAFNATILDGQAGGSVVTCNCLPRTTGTIDGFTIRNGTGTSLYHPLWGSQSLAGGGICCTYASPAIANNTIVDNSVHGTDFDHMGLGAGISCLYASPAITANTILNNIASGEYTLGGGVYCHRSSPAIAKNRIAGNHALAGGGVYCEMNSSLSIVGNTITGNTAGAAAGIGESYNDGLTITNSVIAGNVASGYELDGVSYDGVGGGVYSYSDAWSSLRSISNCTIVGNVASQGGAVYVDGGDSPLITNTIIAFNSSGIYDSSGELVRNSCVFGNTDYIFPYPGIEGSISADPVFRSAGPGPDGTWGTADDLFDDLRLQAGSPCIDAGNNADVPADTPDLDGDGDTSEALPFDLAGRARFFDDPATDDCRWAPGTCGDAPIVDMGAYESHECLLVALAWRSVRTHGAAGDLGIVLDPAAGGAGVDCEPRQFGVQRIEVAFNTDVSGSLTGVVAAEDLTHGGSITATDQYTINGGATLVLEFKLANPAWPASPPEFFGLPDETCYRISLAASIAGLCGDTDCEFRVVAGNTNNDDRTNLADMAQAKLMNGQPLLDAGGLPIPENGRFDVNLDGAISLADMALVKLMNGNGPVVCP